MEAALRSVRPTCVFHLAAWTDTRGCAQDPSTASAINAGGTSNLLTAMRNCSPEARLVLASSSAVYGAPHHVPVGEDHPRTPDTVYGVTKRDAEDLAFRHAREGLDVVIARPFHHVGPGQDPRFAVAGWAVQIASGSRVLRTGRLDLRRDFTDVRDVAEAYVCLATCAPAGGVFNVCTGTSVPLREIVDRLVARHPVQVEEDPARLRGEEPLEIRGDPTRIHGLGWHARRPLGESLADLLDEIRVG